MSFLVDGILESMGNAMIDAGANCLKGGTFIWNGCNRISISYLKMNPQGLSGGWSMVTGSIGMLPSASLAEGSFGMYEPIHGSAPDIAGQDIANPMATILSAAMMLRYSLDLDREADAIEGAVKRALEEGYRTVDIAGKGEKTSGTAESGDIIAGFVRG